MYSDFKATGMNRRQFLVLTAAAVAGTGCNTVENGGSSTVGEERVVNAGPVGDYAADWVYSQFRDEGFFVVRKGEKLFALSAICTHRKCKLIAESDRSFYCKCHGSTFSPDGRVTEGPARRDLPVLPASVDEHGQLLVKVAAG
jgi:Rieske Fe-S protein